MHKQLRPYLRKRDDRNGVIRIEVMADSMRVGKTTAVKVIADGLRGRGKRVFESYEDWQHNPFLKNSYSDPAKNFLESQKWFVKRKWEQIRDGGGGIFIQDVAPEMDYGYAETNRRLGRMSEEDFLVYDQFYRKLDWSVAPAPNLLIYLSVGDDELIRRAMDSARAFETVEPEYFLMMKRVNREWLEVAKKEMSVLVVNTDNLDFAHDSTSKEKLVEMVCDKISL